MGVTILYFAGVREAIGRGEEQLALPAEVVTLGDLIDWLASRGEPYSSALADRDRLRGAIDQVFAGIADPVAGAREIALFPPVTGG
jgi:molybdopterin synthase sulfur carrier subunit